MIRLLDDRNPDRLIAVGAAILIAGITADNVNSWLKQVASRPRYKYLITYLIYVAVSEAFLSASKTD